MSPINLARPRFRGALISCAVLAWLPGCASQTVPAGDVAAADRAIARAVKSGADQWAPKDLLLAREKMALTRRLLAAGDPTPARWLAQQAQVDAELATAKAVYTSAHR